LSVAAQLTYWNDLIYCGVGKHHISPVCRPMGSCQPVFKTISHLVSRLWSGPCLVGRIGSGPYLMGQLGSGPYLVGQIGSGVWVSVSFQKKVPASWVG